MIQRWKTWLKNDRFSLGGGDNYALRERNIVNEAIAHTEYIIALKDVDNYENMEL